MVTKNSYRQGSALAVVLFVLVIMLLLAVTLNQVLVGQLRAVNNSSDVFLAQNYARLALINAESKVYAMDNAAGLETKTPAARYTTISSGTYNIVTNGLGCNSGSSTLVGWCYKAPTPNPTPLNSDPGWQPWAESENVSFSLFPCSSYTASKNGSNNAIPKIDEKSTVVAAQVYNSGDSSLCSQPRYIIEPLQLDFRGFIAAGQTSPIRGAITQNNGVALRAFESNSTTVRSARLYRITVRAFGKSGDTRVTLQEVVAIVGNSQNRNIGDTSSNKPAHNIIPLSIRWLN